MQLFCFAQDTEFELFVRNFGKLKLPVTINNIVSWEVVFHQKNNVMLGSLPKPVEKEYLDLYICQNDDSCHSSLIDKYLYGIIVNETETYTSVLVNRDWKYNDNPYKRFLAEIMYIVYNKRGDVLYRTVLGQDNLLLGSRISVSKKKIRTSQVRILEPDVEIGDVKNCEVVDFVFIINLDGSLSLEGEPIITQRRAKRNGFHGTFEFIGMN